MNPFRSVALVSCLLLAGSVFAQENVGEKLVRIADLANTIDVAKANSYLNGIEAEIGKIAGDYPQLSSWNVRSRRKKWSDTGKFRTTDSLIYGHRLVESKSSKYLDRFGNQSLYFSLKIVTRRRFAYISGSGAGSVAHGWSVAGGCLIAQITTANPMNTKLERKLIDIMENGASREPCY
jgi:hypothetical protein